MKEDVAIEILKQVKEVLDKHDIEYWLDYGALLGAVRDGKLIPWDNDIDLCAWDQEFDKIVAACMELRDNGFIVYFGENKSGIHFRGKGEEAPISILTYHLRNDKAIKRWLVHNDLCYYSTNRIKKRKFQMRVVLTTEYLLWLLSAPPYAGDSPGFLPNIIHTILFKAGHALNIRARRILTKVVKIISKKIGCRYLQSVVPSHYFTNFSTIRFYGMEFKVPSPVEEYLEYRYGKDWRIPKKDYIFYKDDGAIAAD